jgi:hypothetical protein
VIAALYVETGGVYFGLPDVDPWDEARDARLYNGPWPVVAHPPCTRWCCFARANETRFGYKVGDDGGTFAAALAAVRKYGGVLEHPALSLAWAAHDLPEPRSSGGWTLCLTDPGATAYVEQGRYGHVTRKATWLYAVGVELLPLRWGRVNDDTLGAVAWGSYLYKTGRQAHMQGRPRVTARTANETPAAFRGVLLDLARSASVPT